MFSLRRGFTLIELLIVIAVIGILTAAIISILNPAYIQGRARNAARKSDLGAIRSALEMYYSDNGSYPAPGIFSFGQPWSGYMSMVPSDPKTGNPPYTYTPSGAAPNYTGYNLCATLEPSELYCVTNPF